MKKIINDPRRVVEDMLEGIAKTNPNIEYIRGTGVIARKNKAVKVALVSGGGSGHEPAHAGYVGQGMLDAAVIGNVFSSPDPERIMAAVRAVDKKQGVLLIVKNYSGDYMNFAMAKEMAEQEGVLIDSVVVKDDVAVEDSLFSTGRRGIAGTVFVHKIAGAAAEAGLPLEQVKAVAEKVIQNVRSMGVALRPCTIPVVGEPGFLLDEKELEIGTGIHGEPGVSRQSMMSSAEIAGFLVNRLVKDYASLPDKSGVALIVNGLGATPLMELYILANDVINLLEKMGIPVYRSFVGNFMTSLEMAGCSLSLLKLDDEMKQYLDAPCDTAALHV